MKARGRRIAIIAIAFVAVVAIGLRVERVGWGWWWRSAGARRAPPARVIPAGTRVQVEVLNATDTRGLAKSAAFYLRDAGFDVVYYGNSSERHDSTVVRDRSGHADWSVLAQRTMAPAIVEIQPDSVRLVDLTVLVGSLWQAPPDPLRP